MIRRLASLSACLWLCLFFAAELSYGQNLPSHARGVALAAGDFDEDGLTDVAAGYAVGDAGVIVIHRGNAGAIHLSAGASREPFRHALPPFEVPVAPELLVAGDFDADGHLDLVCARMRGTELSVLPGRGDAAFDAEAGVIPLSGRITARSAAEVNRADGLADLVIDLDHAEGPRVIVLEAPDGALRATPKPFPCADAVRLFASGSGEDEGTAAVLWMPLNRDGIPDRIVLHRDARKPELVVSFRGTRYTVTNTAPFGPGSLKESIDDANGNPGRDTIVFDIPGSGPFTIPQWNPMVISDAVTIDGMSQPGYAGTPLIEIDGTSTRGLSPRGIVAGNCVIRGLAFKGYDDARLFWGAGIVEGNRLGGAVPQARSVIAGNEVAGDAG
ncbi:MAG: FG-GAP repeat domain-containing protein, partial [Thermoanaerobaculia bacterium]